MTITAWLGRFFRHCINQADKRGSRRGIVVRQLDPMFMTDGEISDFLHGRCHRINWDEVAIRRRSGAVIRPRQQTALMEVMS